MRYDDLGRKINIATCTVKLDSVNMFRKLGVCAKGFVFFTMTKGKDQHGESVMVWFQTALLCVQE